MAKYLAMRIMDQVLDYNEVAKKYPKYKEQIDSILTEKGYFNELENEV